MSKSATKHTPRANAGKEGAGGYAQSDSKYSERREFGALSRRDHEWQRVWWRGKVSQNRPIRVLFNGTDKAQRSKSRKEWVCAQKNIVSKGESIKVIHRCSAYSIPEEGTTGVTKRGQRIAQHNVLVSRGGQCLSGIGRRVGQRAGNKQKLVMRGGAHPPIAGLSG